MIFEPDENLNLDERYERAVVLLHNDTFLPPEHLRVMVTKLNGRAGGGRASLTQEMIDLGSKNPAAKELFCLLVELVYRQYTSMGGFQATWFPFVKPIEVNRTLVEEFRSKQGLDFLPNWDGGKREPYPLQIYNLGQRSITFHYVIPKHGGYRTLPSGKREPSPDVAQPRVVLRPRGLEVRTYGTNAERIRDDMLQRLQDLGVEFGGADEAQYVDQEIYDRLLLNLKPEVHAFGGKDETGVGRVIHRNSWETSLNPIERDFLQRAAVVPAAAAHIGLEFNDADIRYVTPHPSGYQEPTVVKLKKGYIKFVGKTSEAALERFWEGFDNASAP